MARLNDLFAQTYNLDEHYGGTRGAAIEPILRGRRLTELSEAEADQLIGKLVELRDGEPPQRCTAHFDGGGYELSGYCNRPYGHEGPHNYPVGDEYLPCTDAVSDMSSGLGWVSARG